MIETTVLPSEEIITEKEPIESKTQSVKPHNKYINLKRKNVKQVKQDTFVMVSKLSEEETKGSTNDTNHYTSRFLMG